LPNCVDFKSYRLYEQGAVSSRRVVALISRAKGERMVRSMTAQAGLDRDGETLCFHLLEASSACAVPTFVPKNTNVTLTDEAIAEVSSAAFARAEVQAIAGRWFKHGSSRTARMNEEQRKNRRNQYGIPLPPVDLVERATQKYEHWQEIGRLPVVEVAVSA
jgi:hypothetical protein